jgi:hypothetical protein
MKNIKTLSLIILAGTLTFTSCRKKGCTDPEATNYDAKAKKDDGSCTFPPVDQKTNLKLSIHHLSGTVPFAFNTTYVDGFGNDFQFTRAQVYLSNPEYFDDNGNKIHHHAAYALISPSANEYSFGQVPVGHIHEMKLLFGIDSLTNHADPSQYAAGHPLANQSPTTHWTWNSGYIFLMLEGVVDIDDNGSYDAGETFVFHIGLDANKVKLNLAAHFNTVANVTSTVQLDINWKKFLHGIDLSTENSTHSMGAGAPLAAKVKDNVSAAITLH